MIYNLQSLRALAAINVVIFHIIGTAQIYGDPATFLAVLEGWGANGVDIFFVISGFVMLYTQMHNKRGVLDFFKSRLVRIVPLYWLLTTIVILIFFVAPDAFRETVVTPLWAFASYFFLSGPFVEAGLIGEKFPIVYLGWTLEWEMLFYVIFGLGMMLNAWYASYLLIFLSLCAVALITGNTIILEFFAGMLVAYLYLKHRGLFSQKTGLAILLVGVVLLFASVSDTVKLLEMDRALVWGVPSFLIVLGAVTAKQLSSRIFIYLGDASYSIYLIQVLSIPVFYKLMSKLKLNIHGDLLALTCLLVSVLAGAAMYAVFEKPTTRFLRSKIVGS